MLFALQRCIACQNIIKIQTKKCINKNTQKTKRAKINSVKFAKQATTETDEGNLYTRLNYLKQSKKLCFVLNYSKYVSQK